MDLFSKTYERKVTGLWFPWRAHRQRLAVGTSSLTWGFSQKYVTDICENDLIVSRQRLVGGVGSLKWVFFSKICHINTKVRLKINRQWSFCWLTPKCSSENLIFVRKAVAEAVAEVEEKEERAYTMQTDHNIYLRFRSNLTQEIHVPFPGTLTSPSQVTTSGTSGWTQRWWCWCWMLALVFIMKTIVGGVTFRIIIVSEVIKKCSV